MVDTRVDVKVVLCGLWVGTLFVFAYVDVFGFDGAPAGGRPGRLDVAVRRVLNRPRRGGQLGALRGARDQLYVMLAKPLVDWMTNICRQSPSLSAIS